MATFISYSRINSEFAVRLSRDLKASGFDVWLDQIDIPTGFRWDDEVEKALEASDTFLIILSPESIQSQNVKDEISYAIDAGKHILPVVIENCNVPFRLRRFQYVDFTGKSYEESLDKIKYLLGHTKQLEGVSPAKKLLKKEQEIATGEKHSQSSRPSGTAGPPPAVPGGRVNFLYPIGFAAFALIALLILFRNMFGPAAPTSLPAVTLTPIQSSPPSIAPTFTGVAGETPIVTVPLSTVTASKTPAIVMLTPSETVNPVPKMSRENITSELIRDGFASSLRGLAAEQYSDGDYASLREFSYTVWLNRSENVVWHWVWCASDAAILIQNFEHIGITFVLNGQTLPLTDVVEDQYVKSDLSVCRVYYVTLYDWPAGTHRLRNMITIDQWINDGWSDYPPETRIYDYLVYFSP